MSFSLFLVNERTRREFLLLKTCQIDVYLLYALSTRAYYDITSGDNFDCEKVHEDDIFE